MKCHCGPSSVAFDLSSAGNEDTHIHADTYLNSFPHTHTQKMHAVAHFYSGTRENTCRKQTRYAFQRIHTDTNRHKLQVTQSWVENSFFNSLTCSQVSSVISHSGTRTSTRTSPSLLGPDQAVARWRPMHDEQLWPAVTASSPSAPASLPLTL